MLRTDLNVDIGVRYMGRFYEYLPCMLGSFCMLPSLIFLRSAFKACIVISILQIRELRLRGYAG